MCTFIPLLKYSIVEDFFNFGLLPVLVDVVCFFYCCVVLLSTQIILLHIDKKNKYNKINQSAHLIFQSPLFTCRPVSATTQSGGGEQSGLAGGCGTTGPALPPSPHHTTRSVSQCPEPRACVPVLRRVFSHWLLPGQPPLLPVSYIPTAQHYKVTDDSDTVVALQCTTARWLSALYWFFTPARHWDTYTPVSTHTTHA